MSPSETWGGGGFIMEHPPPLTSISLVVLGYVRTLYTYSSYRNLAFCDIPPPLKLPKLEFLWCLNPPPLVPTYLIALFEHVLPSYVDLLGNTWIRFALCTPFHQNWVFCDIPPPNWLFCEIMVDILQLYLVKFCLFYVDILSSFWISLQFLHFSGKDVSKVQNMSKYC